MSGLQRLERLLLAEEFSTQGAMEAFDLARRGWAARLGQKVLDAVLPADPIKEHLDRWVMESAGEHLAVVGQNLLRNPKGLQRRAQPRANQACNVCRDTPTLSATCDTLKPSAITANTA